MAEKLTINAGQANVSGADLLLAWRITRAGARIAALLVLIAGIVVVTLAIPMLIDIVRAAPREIKAPDDPKNVAEEQKVVFERHLAQIKGRSLFHVPVPPAPVEEPEEANEDRPPPAPTTYGGPALVAMLTDTVWFSGGKKLKVGEAADGVEVVALRPPWDAKLKWKGVEFDVNLFERSKVSKEPSKAAGTSAAPETSDQSERSTSPGATQATPDSAPTPTPPASSSPVPPPTPAPTESTPPVVPPPPASPQSPP
jgi:hypothetical protein